MPSKGLDLGLEGRVALVAGAGRGIGAAIGRALAAQGAAVGLVARTGGEVGAVAESIAQGGGRAVALEADVRDVEATDAALARLAETLGAPSIFVWSVAAQFTHARLPQLEDAEIARLLDGDLVAAMRIARRVIPDMMRQRYGRIVLLSSAAASMGIPGGAAYAAGKAGLEGLARALSVDHGRHGVLSNALRLGFVDTERQRARNPDPESLKRLLRQTVTRRLGDPAQVAAMVAFLCSPLARSVVGSVIVMDDGLHLAPIERHP